MCEQLAWLYGYENVNPDKLNFLNIPRCWNGVPAAWWGGYNTKYCELYTNKNLLKRQ